MGRFIQKDHREMHEDTHPMAAASAKQEDSVSAISRQNALKFAGFGELVGYGLRLVSGLVSDRTKRYWGVTLLGDFSAVAGPLIVAVVIQARSGFRTAFAILLVPALFALAVLVAARFLSPRSQDLEAGPRHLEAAGLPRQEAGRPRSVSSYEYTKNCSRCGQSNFPAYAH
jgi:hypothetical protein